MAEYIKELALTEEVYVRVPKPSGDDRYLARPYNLVTYDDGQQYVEPVSVGIVPFTFSEINPNATASKLLIVDLDPFVGVTEIR
jgi:hypothetical protein